MGDALIVYSTGTFAGYNVLPTTGALGLSALTRVTIDRRGRLLDGEWIPVRILPPGRPTLDTDLRESAALAHELSVADLPRPGIRPSGRLVAGTRG